MSLLDRSTARLGSNGRGQAGSPSLAGAHTVELKPKATESKPSKFESMIDERLGELLKAGEKFRFMLMDGSGLFGAMGGGASQAAGADALKVFLDRDRAADI